MDIELLGPLEVSEQGTSVVPSAGKPRQILALLALRAGQAVPAETLMEELWGDDIPRSAATTLQTYILQLRRRIEAALDGRPGAAAKDILATRFGGYLLQPRDGYHDVRHFEQLSAQGATALEAGDALIASQLLGRAMRLWRGPVLVDVPAGRVLALEVLGVVEGHSRVSELRIEADLRLGRHADLVGELRMLASRHPMHERFHAQLMLAHYRCGNAWRALEVYRQLRDTLDHELGIEPSRALRQLQRAILNNSPRLDALHGFDESDPSVPPVSAPAPRRGPRGPGRAGHRVSAPEPACRPGSGSSA
ncbi:BTAD domain-containing putative transcriptional regulator [Streptomyces sp. NPDC057702]|uniref:AfsR/SARP family transcriptional regulator n=1 Tax=unclassified Streptomyces TaxID=2593676 RepID=UPI00367B1EC0